ncbi:MAG: dihydroorotate dehydrogenase electron transfer subunit [Candidatus Latescibacteria bacterium]|nr:dihydroorotate dehydrogenase electron transfer subunit [Candidatus Latescibacterota bacterium]
MSAAGGDAPRPAALAAVWRRVRVSDLRADGALYWDLRVEGDDLPAGAPGQFSLLSPGADGASRGADPFLLRPLSLLDAGPGWQRFLFKVFGRGSAALAALTPGATLDLLGPLGHPFAPAASPALLLVGGGVGIPPLHMLSRRLAAAGAPHRVLFGFNTAADIPERLLAELAVAVQVSTLDGSAGRRGHPVAQLLDERADDPAPQQILACGPIPMLEALRRAARPQDRVLLSLEERMACGVGVCRGCVVPVRDGDDWRYATVCREGPVFEVGQLATAEALAEEVGHA